MAIFVYDQERVAFIDSVKESLAALCTSEFVRNFRRNEQSYAKINSLWQELGILEFSQDESCVFSDLVLIAKEHGRALASNAIVQRAFLEGYLNRVLSLGLQGESGFAFVVDKAISFVNVKDCSNIFCIPAAGIFSKENIKSYSLLQGQKLTSHESLDLTDLSFVADQKQLSESRDFNESDSLSIKYGIALMLSAELCGIAEKIIDVTSDYVKTRKQYGVQIGSFQAVQHQLAESYLISEAAWSLVECAAHAYSENKTDDEQNFDLTAQAAALYAAENIPVLLETALQLHGGIGFTWEYDLHLYLRRARKIAALLNFKTQSYRQIINTVSI